MRKNRVLLALMIGSLVLAGCITIQYPASAPTATAAPVNITNLLAATQTPQVIYITATAQANVIVVTSTPEPATATPTEAPASLTLTSVVDNGSGSITVYWQATGSFPSGYELVWSASNTAPTFPADSSTYISDPAQTSALLHVDAGRIYYVRLCRYVEGTCDLYSNVGIVGSEYPTATATPVSIALPHNPPRPPVPQATSTGVSPSITITSIKTTAAGEARITWRATGDFPDGFLVMYVEGTIAPSYGDYPYYTVSNGYARSTLVSGNYGSVYTFRVCRFTGTTCDTYSNAYQYTFIGVTPTSVHVPPNNPPRPPR